MIENLRKCKFKYTFRSYQQRVLDESKKHLADKKLNIVAAPGAGKTILALSLMIEIGEPTLIIAPTILLRQQWLDRLRNDFEGAEKIENLISEDIYNPNFITVTTYQSLYSLYRGKSEKSKNIDIVAKLKELNIKTVILDEAHHLKLAWLDAAKSVIEKLEDITTISLTATPPYDVEKSMWNKYINLCGDMDIEVAVPELVSNRDLAPHQDYIYMSYPSHIQNLEIENYTQKIKDFFEKYANSSELVTAISMHEGIINLDSKIDYFIDNFEYYDAMISFLQYNGVNISISKDFNYEYKKTEFNINKMQILLTYCLYNDRKSYSEFSKLFKQILRELNEIGAVYEKKVNLTYTNEMRKTITQNVSKMKSVKDILEFEKNNLRDRLKAVVITENIYKELLVESDDYETKFIGVLPLFRYLSKKTMLKYIVLTGEIILIPTEYKEKLFLISNEFGIAKDDIVTEEISFDFDYCKVDFSASADKNRVLIITKLFEETNADVLIGSNALIGEGWDAPFINTLIMATPVSAYVSANQIRGRVIRKNKKEPDKMANIWHLVCAEKHMDSYKLGLDYENLEKRFEAFEGLNVDSDNISYGIERLKVNNDSDLTINDINESNIKFLKYAGNRNEIYNKWFEALKTYKAVRKNKVTEFEIIKNIEEQKESFEALKENVLITGKKGVLLFLTGCVLSVGMVGGMILLGWLIVLLDLYDSIGPNLIMIGIWLMLIWAVAESKFFWTTKFIYKKILKLKEYFLKENMYNNVLEKFINATYTTLKQINVISLKSKLIINKFEDRVEYYLDNSTFQENEILKNSIAELTSKLDDARYAIKIGKFYFAIPTIIGKKVQYTEIFRRNLTTNSELIYLRSAEGKRELFNIKLLQNNLVSKFNKAKVVKNSKNTIAADGVNMEVMSNYLDKE